MASVAETAKNAAGRELIPGETPHSGVPAAKTVQPEPSALEPTIYRFILKYSLKQQILLLLLTLASFPFLYYSLDLPKTIVNKAIDAKHDFPEQLFGVEFDRVPYLMILCGIFIALVFINGAFKYCINTFKGQIGERMLRRFRYSLYLRLLRFP